MINYVQINSPIINGTLDESSPNAHFGYVLPLARGRVIRAWNHHVTVSLANGKTGSNRMTKKKDYRRSPT
ncbi:hypothetical protein GDO81_001001 [Engystomops pustulosus]|uniref:Uncharacterized protein n=1 Tax=Engystomops pustulosus TaxID=76066 RepID=A0AAV7D920_ENGPU|nr:hypothetical protein GDO81_001001 [Engystomops pustulosus]